MGKDGLCWLTLTLESDAATFIKIKEQLRIAKTADDQWVLTDYPLMKIVVKQKTLAEAVLEYLRQINI